jgi:O-antigen/teichoic acid export membrane protein
VFEAAGAHQAGLYGAVYRVLDQAHFVPISIMTTLFPIISVAFARDRSRVNRLLQQTSDYLAMASLGALAFAIVDARPLVVFLFGNSFASAAPALPILMAAFVLISFGYLVGSMVLILRLQRRFIRYAIAALVFNVALNLALVPPFGFLAAAWITLATEVLVFGLTLRVVLRALEFRPSLLRIARATLAAALLGVALWVVAQIGGGLLADVAVAAICYPALLVALRALRLRELRAILRDKPL